MVEGENSAIVAEDGLVGVQLQRVETQDLILLLTCLLLPPATTATPPTIHYPLGRKRQDFSP